NPVAGAGVGTISQMQLGPHNMFLAMLVEYGLVGLIAYLLMIARLIQIARCGERSSSGMVLFFVAWLIIFGFASENLLGNSQTIPLLGFALARAYRIQSSARSRQVYR